MAKFIFTYGSEGQPFVGGWTVVVANDMPEAIRIFNAIHPPKIPNLVNCGSIYTEEGFMKTSMSKSKYGNLGHRCHEIISVNLKLTKGENE